MGSHAVSNDRRSLWRSRWAAIGAAVAVTLGGGGIVAVQAASSVPSSVVTIDPVRILDTRTDVGLPGPFVSAVSQKLQVTGTAVPAGATGVLLNATVVSPSANGFLSIRPGNATGVPTTSSLNFTAGQLVPNSVQVGLPTTGVNAGQIDITYDAYGVTGPTTEVLIDVVGYTVATALPPSGGVDYSTRYISVNLTGGDIVDLQMMQVTVPEAGHLLVTALAELGSSGPASGVAVCSVSTSPLTEGPIVSSTKPSSSTNTTLTGGFPVSAGTVNLYHNCRLDGISAPISVIQTAITVVFSPSRL